MKELIIEAIIDNLDEVIDFINEELSMHNCDAGLQSEIDVAVEEIFVNVANYAYKPATGKVTISISTDEEFAARFEDAGRAYNPIEHTDPDLNIPIMERKLGGLGILLVRQIMDNVTYERVDDKNVLTMSKRIIKK